MLHMLLSRDPLHNVLPSKLSLSYTFFKSLFACFNFLSRFSYDNALSFYPLYKVISIKMSLSYTFYFLYHIFCYHWILYITLSLLKSLSHMLSIFYTIYASILYITFTLLNCVYTILFLLSVFVCFNFLPRFSYDNAHCFYQGILYITFSLIKCLSPTPSISYTIYAITGSILYFLLSVFIFSLIKYLFPILSFYLFFVCFNFLPLFSLHSIVYSFCHKFLCILTISVLPCH